MADHSKEKHFWDWFEKNKSKYLFLNEVDQEVKEQHLDELLAQLHTYCEGLYFLIGGHRDHLEMELTITADGIREYFPEVEKLVSAAPELENWKIIAFKQPGGTDFITEIGGRKFDPLEIQFIPLETKEDPRAVGIHVCYPDFTEADRRLFAQGTYVMIDSMIGEKACALDIDYLDIIRTPDDVEGIHTLPMSELSGFIKSKKG